jgi:hypothetical protein
MSRACIEIGEYHTSDLPKVFTALHDLAERTNENRRDIILRDLIDRFGDQPSAQSDVLGAIKIIIFGREDYSYSDKYISMIADDGALIDDTDLIAVGYIILDGLNKNNKRLLFELDKVIPKMLNAAPSIGGVFLRNFDMVRQERLGRIDAAIQEARDLLDIFSKDLTGLSSFTKSTRSNIENNANFLLARNIPKVAGVNPFKGLDRKSEVIENNANFLLARNMPKVVAVNPFKGLGRNSKVKVIYPDGKIVESKFKAVQKDLVLGNCKLVSNTDA